MTFIKGLVNNIGVMSRQNSNCNDAVEESCDVAAGSGSNVTGNVDVSSIVGEGKQ